MRAPFSLHLQLNDCALPLLLPRYGTYLQKTFLTAAG